eukprot:465682_1
MALRRITKELKDLKADPSKFYSASPVDINDLFKWKAQIVFEKQYMLNITFPQDYPFKPPKVIFVTKIYHPKVNAKGQIDIDVLKDNWSPALTISNILQCIYYELVFKFMNVSTTLPPISDYFDASDIEKLKGNDLLQQKMVYDKKFKSFQDRKSGTFQDFMWEFMFYVSKISNNEKQDQYQVFKRPKDDISDAKMQNEEIDDLHSLIDFDEAKEYGNGMCPDGHTVFTERSGRCFQCKGGKGLIVMNCLSCSFKSGHLQFLADNKHTNFCSLCRMNNMVKLQQIVKIDKIKSKLIRHELVVKPELSLDILCGLSRAMGLNKIMSGIMDLAGGVEIPNYVLFLVDVDNLKALNSTLSHQGADEVIKQIGYITKKWTNKINNGYYRHKYIVKAWAFRQGGDEFAVIVKSELFAEGVSFSDWFYGWKNEINNINLVPILNKYQSKNDDFMKRGQKTLKDRAKKQILTALNGVQMNAQNKNEILKLFEKGIKPQNIKFKLDKVGISVGLFVPAEGSAAKNWIKKAEEAQDIAKEMKGKNEIRIYYDGSDWEHTEKGIIIPGHKTNDCLRNGCVSYHGSTHNHV